MKKLFKTFVLLLSVTVLLTNCKKENLNEVENGIVTGTITFKTKSFVPTKIDPATQQPLIANVELEGTGNLTYFGDVKFSSKFLFDFTTLKGTNFVTTYTDKNGDVVETAGTSQGGLGASPTSLNIKVTEPISKGTGRYANITGSGTSDVVLDAVKLDGNFKVNWTVTF
jgi:hypothetical protein